MKATLILASLAALVAAVPTPDASAESVGCFVRRADGLYERDPHCDTKRGQADTNACLLKRADGLYERGRGGGCGYYTR